MADNAPQPFNLRSSESSSSSIGLSSIHPIVHKAKQFGNSIIESGGRVLNNAIDGGRCFAKSIISIRHGLRQEVPYERWFYDHNFDTPLDNCNDLIKAHLWAVVATAEGVVRALAEVVSYVFALAFETQEDAKRHFEVLEAQATGLALSLLAIVSPNHAKTYTINSDGKRIIGAPLTNWRWGTLYTGSFDIPFWKIECCQYPWADRPNS